MVKKSMPKIMIVIFSIIMVLSIGSISVFAEGETVVNSGSCGTDRTWTLTGETGNYTLTISGSGAMTYYTSGSIGLL